MDPVDKIDGTQKTERRKTRSGLIRGEHPKRRPDGVENDSVDISEEARERASGKK